MNNTGYIKLVNDKWDENGKIYRLLSFYRPVNSTGCQIELELLDGTIEKKVVSYNEIEWIEDGDW